MKIDVDRQDLISRIKGIDPSFSQMDIPAVAANGDFSGSYCRWNWRGDFEGIDDQSLYDLYRELK